MLHGRGGSSFVPKIKGGISGIFKSTASMDDVSGEYKSHLEGVLVYREGSHRPFGASECSQGHAYTYHQATEQPLVSSML